MAGDLTGKNRIWLCFGFVGTYGVNRIFQLQMVLQSIIRIYFHHWWGFPLSISCEPFPKLSPFSVPICFFKISTATQPMESIGYINLGRFSKLNMKGWEQDKVTLQKLSLLSFVGYFGLTLAMKLVKKN